MSSSRLDEPTPGGEGPIAAPPTVQRAFWAAIAWAVLSVLSALSLFTARPYLRRVLIENNAKSKTPVADYTLAKVDHDIDHSIFIGNTAQSVLLAVILVMLAFAMRRGRGWARWMLVAFATFIPLITGLAIGIVNQFLLGLAGRMPGLYRATLITAGLAALTVVVLLLLPESSRYFTALRPASRRGRLARPPATARPAANGSDAAGREAGGTGASRRPGGVLATLFAPKRPARDHAAATAAEVGSEAVAGTAVATPAAGNLPSARPARRAVVTRPGSVKPKGTGARSGRSKSRQESTDSRSADSE